MHFNSTRSRQEMLRRFQELKLIIERAVEKHVQQATCCTAIHQHKKEIEELDVFRQSLNNSMIYSWCNPSNSFLLLRGTCTTDTENQPAAYDKIDDTPAYTFCTLALIWIKEMRKEMNVTALCSDHYKICRFKKMEIWAEGPQKRRGYGDIGDHAILIFFKRNRHTAFELSAEVAFVSAITVRPLVWSGWAARASEQASCSSRRKVHDLTTVNKLI